MAEKEQEGTEQSTAKRRDKAREDGQIPRSRDLSSAAVLFCSAIALKIAGPYSGAQLRELLGSGLALPRAQALDESSALAAIGSAAACIRSNGRQHRHEILRRRPVGKAEAQRSEVQKVGLEVGAPGRSLDRAVQAPRWGGRADSGATPPGDHAGENRHHHRCKQSEGWQLDQPEPGVLTWRTPAGRTYVTHPTQYPAR